MCKEKTEFSRLCPKCERVMFYKSIKHLNDAIKTKTICKQCARALKQERTEFIRLCPKCGKEIFYRNAVRLANAVNKNKPCTFGCSHRGVTNVEIYGEEKAELISNKMSESHSGENNYNFGLTNVEYFGESRAAEISKKHTESSSGTNHPRFNKTNIEFYGKEKANELALKNSETHKGKNNYLFGKTHEEYFGKEKANEISKKLHDATSGENHFLFGKSFDEYYAERADEIKEKRRGENHHRFGLTNLEYYGLDKTKEIHDKTSGENHFMFGKTFEEIFGPERAAEMKLNMRLRLKKQIEETGGKMIPNYSRLACLHFDIIMEETGTFIQHAQNGGEFQILGYFVDGYDKENNIVYEWDERQHFNFDGTYIERDVRRQAEIVEFLKCEFVRIKAF